MTPANGQAKQRVPAAQRREALIAAAIEEFARGGLHGTPVDRIARRVGVAQPYVFSLFPSKRDLFIAAVERGFQLVGEAFAQAAAAFDPETAGPDEDLLEALGKGYMTLVDSDRSLLMLQLQAYAACDDELIRERVRACWVELTAQVLELSGAQPEELDEFFSYGMWLTVQAAIGVGSMSELCESPRARGGAAVRP